MRNAPDLQVVPEKMEVVPELKEAFQIANESNMSREELYIQERKMIFLMDQRSAIVKANQEGMDKGRDEGRGEGRQEMAKEIARRLLNQMNDQEITAATGLPLSEIAALRNEQK